MSITRRDFLDGVALTIGAGLAGCGRETAQAGPYPPALAGMRGSHDGAFEAAHRVRDGERFDLAKLPVEERYDLVVVGSGLSGLAAAWFFRRRNPGRTVLLLDPHDDFGGHAKRNEFRVGDKLLIGYGGSESLQSPHSEWSDTALGLLKDLGVDIDRLAAGFDRDHYPKRGMSRALFFDRATFGADKLVPGNPWRSYADDLDAARLNARPLTEFLADAPLPEPARRQLLALWTEPGPWPRKQAAAIAAGLDRISYRDFLLKHWKADSLAIATLRNLSCDFFAVGIDGITAADAHGGNYPGFLGLPLEQDAEAAAELDDPYIHHFPDGNASLARLLVRQLIPGIAPGSTMEDVVLAPFDYTRLDRAGQTVRIRQSATVVHVAQQGTPGEVDIGYVSGGKLHRVRGRACVLACWNMMIPYICPELAEDQAAVLRRNVKGPLTYTNLALRDWRAWDKLKVHSISNPSGFYSLLKLDYPVSMGGYRFAQGPVEPILAHLVHVPTVPEVADAPLADKYRAARFKLQETPFAKFEAEARRELAAMLGAGGFDFDASVAGITVNRWSHGYAYYPTALYHGDEAEAWPEELGSRKVGRIGIANSDAGWDAYAHTAIDQAWRAVSELGLA